MNYKILLKSGSNFLLLITIIFLFSQCSEAQKFQTGSWGDQGDGTYINPILNADYPDVDVEQAGDTYYMISSKQHMSPGMVILESKDMVNWMIIGHIWDSLAWAPEYNWNHMNGYSFGVWAGDLAFHDGTWYCYQIDNKHGLYMSTASDIRGPWSAPKQMLKTEFVLDDPAVFWDDETHEAYLICNTGNKQRSPDNNEVGNENRIYKMSWDGNEILDSGQLVYTGPGAEAAKIYKFEGEYYIFMGEWYRPDPRRPEDPNADKNDRKQIVLRSKNGSIYGPYEKRIVMERGNGIIRSCSQGALMKAPDSSWWYTHQLIQNIESPFQGRPQCLEPVTWVDGWPIIGEDADGDGIGEPVLKHMKPIQGFSLQAPQTDDDFSDPKLDFQWEWNHNPRNSHWSLSERPGWLRLKAGVPLSYDKAFNHLRDKKENDDFKTIFWHAYNTLSQRIMGNASGTATAKFSISGMESGQRAGFVRFGGVFNLLGIYMDESGKHQLFFMDWKGEEKIGPVIQGDDLYIRTTNHRNQAFFEYSTDGISFEPFGPEFTLKFGKWTGDRLGFFCWNEKAEKGYIDVDYFHYDYDGPKSLVNRKQDIP